MKALFILNPNAGSGRLKNEWAPLSEKLKSHLKQFDAIWTEGHGDGTRLTRQALDDGYTLICSVGGDGTLNECLNGFLKDGKPVNPKAALSVLPFGRGSDFCRTLGIPREPLEAMKSFQKPKVRVLDVGRAEFVDLKGRTVSRYFLNIANVGIVPEVVNQASKFPKALGAKGAYLFGTLKGALEYKAGRVRCSGIKGLGELSLLNMVVANGKYFGCGMKVAPEAKLNDGLLDVLTVRRMKLADFLVHLPYLYTGKVLKIPQVHYSRNTGVKVEAVNARDKIGVEMDGEAVGKLPARFEILPKVLRFQC